MCAPASSSISVCLSVCEFVHSSVCQSVHMCRHFSDFCMHNMSQSVGCGGGNSTMAELSDVPSGIEIAVTVTIVVGLMQVSVAMCLLHTLLPTKCHPLYLYNRLMCVCWFVCCPYYSTRSTYTFGGCTHL